MQSSATLLEQKEAATMAFPTHTPPEKLTVRPAPELMPGFPDDVTDPGRDRVAAVLGSIAALPPRPAPIVLPDLGGNLQATVKAIVTLAKPSDQAADQTRVDRLKAKMGARANQAQYDTHKGRSSDLGYQIKFIIETAADLREVDRIARKWSGGAELAPEALNAQVLEQLRSVDAWSNDSGLLVQHTMLVKNTNPDQARDHVQHLADNYQHGECPCGRTEYPEDAIWRFLGDAVATFQAVKALAQALATDDSRAVDVRKALAVAGREKVIKAIVGRMPFLNRSLAIKAKLDQQEAELAETHPRTWQHGELSQKIEVSKTRHKIALEAEETERAQAVEALVSSAERGSLAHITELQERTAGSLLGFSVDLRKARASDKALTAVVGFLIHSDDQKKAAAQREIAKRLP
jgi:hypothetical protein